MGTKIKWPVKHTDEVQLKLLAKNECANYAVDHCAVKDRKCVVEEKGRCQYFETSVMPLNPGLTVTYEKITREKSDVEGI